MKSLREVRRECSMSQALLAGQARVSLHLLMYAEAGRYRFSATQAQKIADALGVRTDEVAELADSLKTTQQRPASSA